MCLRCVFLLQTIASVKIVHTFYIKKFSVHSVHEPFNLKQTQTLAHSYADGRGNIEREREVKRRSERERKMREKKTDKEMGRAIHRDRAYKCWSENRKNHKTTLAVWLVHLLPMIQYTLPMASFSSQHTTYFSYRLTIESTRLASSDRGTF